MFSNQVSPEVQFILSTKIFRLHIALHSELSHADPLLRWLRVLLFSTAHYTGEMNPQVRLQSPEISLQVLPGELTAHPREP